ncbi:toxin-antitoxin system YwqK family antitoxin [Ferruginibacter sp.]
MKYTKGECPVDSYDKNWIEKALVWFEQKLGSNYIRSRKYLIPAHCHFNYPDFNTQEAIEYFITYICDFIEFDRSLVDFTLIWDKDELEGFTEEIGNDISISKKYGIDIYTKDLNNFDITFNSIAYQLVFMKLVHKTVFNFPNKYMMDLAMLIEGFGILKTNNFIVSRQSHDFRYSEWSVKSFGVFNHRMYGYSLALLNEYCFGENNDALEAFLCPDAKACYRQSKNYLAQEKESSSPTQTIGIIKDEEVFIRKDFYENGSIRIISHVVNGKYEGMMTFFHQNGLLWSQRLYKNNNSYTVFSNFNKYDEPVEKGTLFEGNGTLYIYKPNGILDYIEEYKDGLLIKQTFHKD